MLIRDAQGNSLDSVYLELTDAEAKDFVTVLMDLLTADDPAWHVHVDNHTHTVEIIVAPDPAGPRFAKSS